MKRIIDAHIHLDHYALEDIEKMMDELASIECTHVVSVSSHLESCRLNARIAKRFSKVKTAYGYHPEQALPTDRELSDLLAFMEMNKNDMIAVGEVGLPYYKRMEQGPSFSMDGYLEMLDVFLQKAKEWDKPVVLHAVYDDAPLVCDLLEKHSIRSAHFHWFKGDAITVDRMIANGYMISITPDVLYEEEIQALVQAYPLEGMMAETDGPWPFEGPFQGSATHPRMLHDSIPMMAKLKGFDVSEVYETLYENTRRFYNI